ncbi:alanine--tRNA ligase [Propionicicella superfundia]|uniref:alanine--tRNA ligase n=1 Tax=Propionicicella superfundia TaxID=348582 RepID=UPI000429AA6F|nr:alanine--tRNA ligase [Propionicicella superfundia]
MKTAEIRRRFLDFFAARGHAIVPSAPLVYNDPTLLFVNAGMVPFKPYFTGAEDPPWARAASVQKCVRTLDIEDVGKTTRHGTFFQMPGNFSFGDYFKAEAIEYAWELVTGSPDDGNYGFDPARVWVTVYLDDDEAAGLWRGVGVPPERIQRRGLKDNYWHMGIPGPGGPCSEIYIDRGPEFGPDGGPVVDEDRFLEIWNLVFQTEELSEVRAKEDFDVAGPLPSKNIDTGMGLERVAFLLQGKDNMYEIDEIYPVIARAAELSGKRYGADRRDDVRMRVVGDHTRSALMLMTDGVAPGNEARGYVLRRLLRRVIRSMRLLGVEDPVLPELLPVSRDLMSRSYAEVASEWTRVSQNAYAEEEAFRRTLAAGTQIFDLAATAAKNEQQSVLSGERAFQLHDTYGFPIDLTLEMAAEQGLSVDRDEFTRLMAEQRARAKADAKAKKGGQLAIEAYRELRSVGETRFLGYTDLASDAKILGIVSDGELVTKAGPGDVVEVVLDQTPFYAESGGQDADAGRITGNGLVLDVLDVQRPVQGLIVHKVRVSDGELVTGGAVTGEVSGVDRLGACQAHSATHVVHAILREILGPTAVQAGSYNKPGYLRFDFSSTVALDETLRQELEGRANEAIKADLEVSATQLPLADAKALGAMAMFGEKYPEIVRMVEMGGPWSRELCGGTHVERSSQIGLLTLLGESSVGSGVRRVEALVSTDAFSHLAAERALVTNLAELLKVQPGQLTDRVGALVAELKDAHRTIADLKRRELAARIPQLLADGRVIADVRLVTAEVADADAAQLRDLALDVRDRLGAQAGVVALFGGASGKPSVVVATTAAARAQGRKAGTLVGAAVAELGGRGGGRDDIAQGGGTDAAGIPAAVAAVERALSAP